MEGSAPEPVGSAACEANAAKFKHGINQSHKCFILRSMFGMLHFPRFDALSDCLPVYRITVRSATASSEENLLTIGPRTTVWPDQA